MGFERVGVRISWPQASLALALLVSITLRTVPVLVFGVQYGADSANYLQAASEWRGSHFDLNWLFSEYQGRRPLYVTFLALASSLGLHAPIAPAIVQAVISAGVPSALYAGVRLGGGSTCAAWATWALATLSYELTRWNAYILSDALFIDLSAFALVAMIISLRTGNRMWSWLTGFAIAAALFVRETAVALAAATFLAGVIWRPAARTTVILVLAAWVACFSYFTLSPLPLADRGTPLDGVCTYLTSGRTIWGMDSYRLPPIPELANDKALTPRQCIHEAITRFPQRAATITLYKAFLYWTPGYAHYSPRHRLANVVLLGGPFVLAMLALLSRPWLINKDPLKLVPLLWVLSFTALHAATWVEGDHRFLAPALPAVYVLAGSTAAVLLERVPKLKMWLLHRQWS